MFEQETDKKRVLEMDKKDIEFELDQIELEWRGIDIAAWRKKKQLRQRWQDAQNALEQNKLLTENMEGGANGEN